MSEKTLPKDGKIIWRWTPPLLSNNDINEVADEYVILSRPSARGGVIIYGKYHDQWEPNPSSRHVVAELLRQNSTISEATDNRLFRIQRLAYEAGLNHKGVIGFTNEIEKIAKELRKVG